MFRLGLRWELGWPVGTKVNNFFGGTSNFLGWGKWLGEHQKSSEANERSLQKYTQKRNLFSSSLWLFTRLVWSYMTDSKSSLLKTEQRWEALYHLPPFRFNSFPIHYYFNFAFYTFIAILLRIIVLPRPLTQPWLKRETNLLKGETGKKLAESQSISKKK